MQHFLTGLIGAGIAASRSPFIHEQEGRALGLHVFYQLLDLDRTPHNLPTLLNAAQGAGFAGVNITHPCKQSVIPFLDELSPEAQAIGAVNTVVFKEGKRHGHNTDCYGFAQSFRRGLANANLTRVLLLGAGGAGSAVAHAAVELGTLELAIFDEDQARAEALAEKLRAQFGPTRAHLAISLEQSAHTADGLIHATPTGMAAHPGIAIAPEHLRPEMWVAEIVYFPLETELLKAARARHCRTLDGGAMAVLQAARAFELFTSIKPDEERMLKSFQ